MIARVYKANELHESAADKSGFTQVKMLIEENPEIINVAHTVYGTTAIEFAAQSGSVETVRYLIAKNANIDAASENKRNLLFWASVHNNQEVVDYIANPDNKFIENFKDGTTYFHAAIVAGKYNEVMQCLSENPSLLTNSNREFQSPLYWAMLAKKYNISNHFIQQLSAEILLKSNQEKICIKQIFNVAKELSCLTDTIKDAIGLLHTLVDLCFANSTAVSEYYLVKIYNKLALCYMDIDNEPTADKYFQLSNTQYKKIQHPLVRSKQLSLQDSISYVRSSLFFHREVTNRGLEYVAVQDDSDSFYQVMIDQLKQLDDPVYADINSKELRNILVNHLTRHSDIYANVADQHQFEKYLAELLMPNACPDEMGMKALSRELNMTFAIVNSDGSEPKIIKPVKPCATLKFGLLANTRFYSLHAKSDMRKQILQEIDWLPSIL